ncbi:hypothetical protein PFZ55_39830 [Streptomyces sp. MS2A]|nr:hypothetical protein [Streptomyces sp. MS2A]
MTKRISRSRSMRIWAAVATATLAALAALTPGVAFAADGATEGDTAPVAEWVATGPNGEVFTPTGPLVPEPSESEVGPKLLDPATWAFCYVANDIDYPISEYTAAYFSGFQGKVNLTCGDSTFGYKHIASKHATQWEPFAYLVNGTWDDFMAWSLGTTLGAPSGIANHEPGKLCYVTSIFFSNGSKEFTIYSKAVISQNNRWVVTAFPSTKPLSC